MTFTLSVVSVSLCLICFPLLHFRINIVMVCITSDGCCLKRKNDHSGQSHLINFVFRGFDSKQRRKTDCVAHVVVFNAYVQPLLVNDLQIEIHSHHKGFGKLLILD